MRYDVTLKYTAELLRGTVPEDLIELLTGARRAAFELRSQSSSERLLVTDIPGKIRKDIARIMTVMRER